MNGTGAMAQAVAQALLHFLWQGAAVGLAVGWVLHLLARAKASTRYAVAVGALLLMAALPFATAARLAGSSTAPGVVAAAAAAPAGPSRPLAVPPGALLPARTFGASLLPWIFGLWLSGVAGLSLYHLAGWRWARRLSRQGQPIGETVTAVAQRLCCRLRIGRAIAFLESSTVSVPMVVGWLRPVVLIPASALTGLSPQQLEAILAHELAHVRRHDYLVNLFQTAVETLLFYHPAVWWVSAQVRRERENCCDDLAVAVCGDRLGYARALVDLEGLRGGPQLALAANGGSLSDRVRRLVGAPRRPARRSWAAGLLALGLVPAVAVLQLACHRHSAVEAPVSISVEQGTWTATLGSDDQLTVEVTPHPKPPEGIVVIVAKRTHFRGLEVSRDARFDLREGDWTYLFRGSFDGQRGQGTYTRLQDPVGRPGTWSAQLKGDRMRLEVSQRKEGWGSWTSVDEYPVAGFTGFTPGRDVRFELRRDAGTFRFRGSFDGDRGRGTFVFAVNPAFARAMRYSTTNVRLLDLALNDVSFDFVRQMKDLGYDQAPSSKAWAHHGVFQFVHQLLGVEPPDSFADRLAQFRRMGITPEYARGMQEAGLLHVLPWQLVELRNHGIEPEYVKGLKESGYRRLFPGRIIDFQTHGITADWLRGMVDAGLADAAPDELISLHNHGIDAAFIHKAREAGYRDTRPEELISLRSRGKV